jgi:hypothetical protein
MEAVFTGTAKDGKIIWSSDDVEKYFLEHDGLELIAEFKLAARVGPKMKLYSYYHGPLLACAVIGYTYRGYEGIDKVKADYLLRAELAKDFIRKPDGTYEVIMLDKKAMSAHRLLKFVQDCVYYLELELGQTPPDAEEYKVSKIAGRKFKTVK